MKKILSRIFSVVLMAATVATPSMAQLAKKAGGKADVKKATITMKAQPARDKKAAKGGKSLNILPKRQASGPFRTAKSGKAAGVKKVASYEAANIPTLYGAVIYQEGWGEGNTPYGLYNVSQSQTSVVVDGINASSGGVCVDGIYYSVDYFSFWGMVFVTVYGHDVESGEKVCQYDGEVQNVPVGGMTVDPSSGTVYGIGYNAAGDGLQLAKFAFTETECTVTPVAAIEGNWNTIACTSDGQLYGISYTGETQGESFVVTGSELNKIDKATGAVTVVGSTGCAPMYLSSGCIDPKTNRMFWDVCAADETSVLYEVNLSTGAATPLMTYDLGDEIMGMYVPAPAAEPTAPAECKNVEFHFDGASLAGTVTLTTPATLFDGTTQGSGELFVMVLANGEIVAGGEPQAWNSQITIPVDLSLMGAGMYDFTVFASGDGGDGPKTMVKNVWVGADTPEATTAELKYENGNMELSWLPVTGTVNGGYLDTENLTYKVVRADGSVAAEGLTVTSFTEAVAEPESITSYYYTVYAVAGDLVSAEAKSNTVVLGSIVPPYTADFLTNGLDGWNVIDSNDDGKEWAVQSDGSVMMTFNSGKDMDDWLITPPVKLEKGKAYLVAFDSKARGAKYPERLEVKYGKNNTVAGMTNTLIAAVDIISTEYTGYSAMLVPEEDGVYYVGFHGISDADMFSLYLSNIQIEAGVASTAPGLATNLTATPDAAGALKCNVSFNAPATDMAGNAISSLTKVDVLRGETVVKSFDAPAVGAALSCDDTLTEGGDVTYTVIGYNADGAGLKASVSAFVGFAAPSPLETATIARTSVEGEVVVSWDAVTTDINGLAFPAGTIKYAVYTFDGNTRVLVADDLTATSYTFQAVEAGEQDFVQAAVFPVYEGEEGDGALTDMIPVGTPYPGIAESFPGATLNYIWGLSAIDGGSVSIYDDASFSDLTSQDSDGGFIAITGDYADTGANLFSGLISLDQMVNPGLTFYTYNIVGDEPDINEITVSVREAGQEEWTPVYGPKTVNEIVGDGVDGWGKITVPLDAYANKVIQFQITGITKQYVYTMIDNIKVGSLLANDLKAVSITAPEKVKTGASYKVDVVVSNEGKNAADAYSVELYKDEELVATKDLTDLASGARATVSFDETMSAIATEPVSYYAKVVYAADENESDNQTKSVSVTPQVSNLPVATDLAGESVDNGVKLTWTEPNLEAGVAEEVTQDFEDADAFSAEYGDWTFVDGDDAAVGGFQNMEVPGITVGETKGSFWIWDASQVGNQTFAAHSGSKYLFALFRYDGGQTDDYAISPELSGDAQTISFYARSYSGDYPEDIRVLYNTTAGVDPTDGYAEIMAKVTVPGEWTLYTVDLPAGAKHFAINSFATDSFMLMVDDVTFTPAGNNASLELKGYNVYRDGVKINDAPVQETEYLDTQVENGKQYTYVVTAVYDVKGESAASNEEVVTFQGSGVDAIGNGAVSIKAVGHDIVVLNAAGQNVSVVAANGAVVFNGVGEAKTTVAVASGVYVVKAGKAVKKVIVK